MYKKVSVILLIIGFIITIPCKIISASLNNIKPSYHYESETIEYYISSKHVPAYIDVSDKTPAYFFDRSDCIVVHYIKDDWCSVSYNYDYGEDSYFIDYKYISGEDDFYNLLLNEYKKSKKLSFKDYGFLFSYKGKNNYFNAEKITGILNRIYNEKEFAEGKIPSKWLGSPRIYTSKGFPAIIQVGSGKAFLYLLPLEKYKRFELYPSEYYSFNNKSTYSKGGDHIAANKWVIEADSGVVAVSENYRWIYKEKIVIYNLNGEKFQLPGYGDIPKFINASEIVFSREFNKKGECIPIEIIRYNVDTKTEKVLYTFDKKYTRWQQCIAEDGDSPDPIAEKDNNYMGKVYLKNDIEKEFIFYITSDDKVYIIDKELYHNMKVNCEEFPKEKAIEIK